MKSVKAFVEVGIYDRDGSFKTSLPKFTLGNSKRIKVNGEWFVCHEGHFYPEIDFKKKKK